MKIKTTLFLLTLTIASTLILSTAFAQYEPYMQMGLPEGAKARLGQGELVGRIAYSSNVNDTWIAVASHIGIWIYDAATLQVRDLLRTPPNLPIMRSSPDGSILAAPGFENGSVKLWNVSTGTLQKTLTGHLERVTRMRFSPDGSILATGSEDRTVRLWDVATGTLHDTFEGDFRSVYNMRFSPDGSILAAAFDDGVRLWDVATGALRNASTGHTTAFLQVHFSPDGDTLTTWSADRWGENGNVRLWDVATGTLRNTSAVPAGTVYNMRFSPDGSILATGNWDGNVHLWDVATGTLRDTFNGNNYPVQVMRFSPDGSILATGNENDEKVRLWDVSTGTIHRTLHVGEVYGVSFSPDGRTLATGSWDGTVRLWDVATGVIRQGLEWDSWGDVRNVRFSPDGRTLAIRLHDGTVHLWDVTTGVTHKVSTGSASSLSFSPDGRTLAIGLHDGTVHLWDVTTGTVHNILELHHPNANRISSLSFSPDGSKLAAGTVRSYVVELPMPEPLDDAVYVPVERVSEVGISTLSIWDVTTGQQKPFFRKYVHSIYSVCFNSDGRTLAVAAGHGNTDHGDVPPAWDDTPGALNKTNIDLWDTFTGTLHKTLEVPNFLFDELIIATEMCFSPDGSTLAAVFGGTMRLWDVATDTFLTFRTGHTSIIFSLSFSPDGRTLATGSWDGTVRLWDVSTGEELRKILTVGPWGVSSVSFSPDGDTLATGSSFGTVLLWEVEPARVTPQLTEDINGDGVVNIQDLVIVASRFGQTGENNADVNGDGVVNIQDLVLVAAAFGAAPAAPIVRHHANEHLTPEVVQQWLATAKQLAHTDATAQRGIAVLEALLTALTPKETALLPNYPNPFNPETWIPYQLAKSIDVNVLIYSADGKLVRTLKLGQQAAGIYESRSHAAYWDGKNEVGESVASGMYFYILKADDFNATRKMLIRK